MPEIYPPQLHPLRAAGKQRLLPLLRLGGVIKPGRLRGGLAQGMRSCDCLGLPLVRSPRLTTEEQFYTRLSLRGQTIYDIGAHVGIMTLFFSRAAGPSGRVIAWEPMTATFAKLQANVRANQITNVQVRPAALGARAEARKFYACAGAAGMASGAETPLTASAVCLGEAAVETLDEVILRDQLPPPHWMKIDVEGMETQVLQGARATLEKYHPQLVIEMHGDSEAEKLLHARGVLNLLAPLGYSFRHIESDRAVAPQQPELVLRGHIYCNHI